MGGLDQCIPAPLERLNSVPVSGRQIPVLLLAVDDVHLVAGRAVLFGCTSRAGGFEFPLKCRCFPSPYFRYWLYWLLFCDCHPSSLRMWYVLELLLISLPLPPPHSYIYRMFEGARSIATQLVVSLHSLYLSFLFVTKSSQIMWLPVVLRREIKSFINKWKEGQMSL